MRRTMRFLFDRQRATIAGVVIVIALFAAPSVFSIMPFGDLARILAPLLEQRIGGDNAQRVARALNFDGALGVYQPFEPVFVFVLGMVVSLQILLTLASLSQRSEARVAGRAQWGKQLVEALAFIAVVIAGAFRPHAVWAGMGLGNVTELASSAAPMSGTCAAVIALFALRACARAPTSGPLALFVGERLFHLVYAFLVTPTLASIAAAVGPLAVIALSAVVLARFELDDARLAWAGLGSVTRVQDVALVPWGIGAVASWLVSLRLWFNARGPDIVPSGVGSALDGDLVRFGAQYAFALVALVALAFYLRWTAKLAADAAITTPSP